MCLSLRALGVSLLCSLIATPAFAQTVTPQEELRAYVVAKSTMPLPDAGAFGEQINPLTGELTLLQTDALLGTNGLPLSVTRRFTPGSSRPDMPRTGDFADWQLELPRITTLAVRDAEGHGWQVSGAKPNARCSAFAPPPPIDRASLPGGSGAAGSDDGSALNTMIDANVWWQGYQLIMPGQDEQEILLRDPGNKLMPQMPMSFPLVTAQQWQISCLPQTGNNEPGEAFLAVAPNGVKYTFDHLVYQQAPALSLENIGTLNRQRASMLVTRIEDRFGNTQQFHYDGDRLTSIENTSKSGEVTRVALSYRSDVPSLVDQVVLRPFEPTPRTWTYHYANLGSGRETLTDVTRPDGTTWHYDLQSLAEARLNYRGTTICNAVAAFDASQSFSGTLTDPNGLTERVTLAGVRHGRSKVVNDCSVATRFPWKPSQYDTLSLTQRSYSGANTGSPVWNYRYAGSSEASAWMEVVDPDQRVTRFAFSNTASVAEGRLQTVDTDRKANGTASRSVSVGWAYPTGASPLVLGVPAGSRVNADALGGVLIVRQQQLTQDGNQYTTLSDSYSNFAQPTRISGSNNIAGQSKLRTDIVYLNDLSHWVLGLPQSVSDSDTKAVISQNVYDLAQVTLKESYRFGLKQASYTYTEDGLLASVSDGNGLTTRYQDYALGTPRSVAYADSTRATSQIDSFGNIVTHMNRAGVTTTADYDSMGRITRTHRPASDGVTWNDTTYNYAFVTQGEWGVQPGHWRVQEDHGEALRFTFYDALMRPVWRSERSSATDGNAWSTQRQDYDWHGRSVFTSYPLRGMQDMSALTQGIRVDVDALSRPIASRQDSEQGVLTTTLAYLSGARTQVTDSQGAVTTTSYQVFGEPDTRTMLKIDAPEGISQTITRNVFGQPLTLTQSGLYQNADVSLARQYLYDAHMRLCRTAEPETGSTVVDYDAGNRVTWSAQGLSIEGNGCGREQVADAAKTTRTYDAMNRVLSVAYPAGTLSSQFTYDAMGRVTSADTGLSRWTYAYNSLSLPTSETLTVDGLPYTLSYAYDANGGLASTTYPDGRVVDHAPDAWGRATQAGSYASAARYLPNGELEYFKYGNGIEYFAEQNARSLPRNLSYMLPNGQLLFSQDFSYDPNGNLTQANDLLQGAGSQRNFQYDTLNRLTRATLPGATNSETYSYDPLNNLRRIVNDTGLVRDYQYDPLNRLSQAVGSDGQPHQFAYDNRGNVTQRDGTPFTFDVANRLTEVSGRESYVYDAFGRRVLKTRLGVGGNKTYYVYSNQAGQLMLQRDNDVSSTETDYIYLGNKLVAQAIARKHDLPGAISFTPGSPTDGIYTIAWGRSEGVAAYELEEQHDDGEWRQIYRGSDTSYTIAGNYWDRLGGTYLYRLRACGSACGGWVMSSPMGVTPQTVDWHTFVPFEGVFQGGYRLSWTGTYGATSYDVDERHGNTWERIATGQIAPYIDRPGGRALTTIYRVTARNEYGARVPAETGEITEDPSTSGPPMAPAVTFPVNGDLQVRFPYALPVTWTSVGRATYYEASVSGRTCRSGENTCSVGVAAGQFNVRVRACNDAGCSPWSPIVVVNIYAIGGIPLSFSGELSGSNAAKKPNGSVTIKEGQP